MLSRANKRRKLSHPKRPVILCKDSPYGSGLYPYKNLRTQCLWVAIDHGLLGPAISDGRMPPYLVFALLREAGYFALNSNNVLILDRLFDDKSVPQYREAMMAHPLLYREYEFIVTSVKDIQRIPRDIARLTLVRFHRSQWEETKSFFSDFSALTSLKMWVNGIGPEGAAMLANSTNLTSLTSLYLQSNGIGPEGAASLANSPNLSSLLELNLGNNRIGPEGAASLANSTSLTSLTSLHLQRNGIGPEGAASLANSTNLASLTSLNLWGNRIGDEGAASLANSANLASLTSLDLRSNEIGPEGAASLKEMVNCKVQLNQ